MRFRYLTAALTIGCLSVTALAEPDRDAPSERDRVEPNERQERQENQEGNQRERAERNRVERNGQIQIEGNPRVEVHANPRVIVRTEGREAKMEKGPYLGVSTSTPPASLRRQLSLPAGVGLVVDFIEPKGPADEAGLKQYDVLNKLDDQILINQQQLAVLVRTHKPGEEVKLSIIRDGKPRTITAKLGEKELPPLDELRLGNWEQFEGMMPNLAQPLPPGAPLNPVPARPVVPGEKRDGQRRIDGEKHIELRLNDKPGNLVSEGMMLVWEDDKHSFRLESRDGQRHLLLKDKDGKVLFDDEISTPEMIKKLPKEVLKKLESIPWLRDLGLDEPKDKDRREPRDQANPKPRDHEDKPDIQRP